MRKINKTIILVMGLALLTANSEPLMAQRKAKTATQTTVDNSVKPIVVTGTVVDEKGEPVIGASVVIAGNTRLGVATDIDGKFSIKCPSNAKLKVSYIGFQSQTVSNLNNPRVVLHEDATSLEDVVVVGYGAMKQKNVTGAVEVINTQDLQDLSVTSLSEALVASSPSIHVDLPSTGRPGEQASITIRQAKTSASNVNTGTDAGGVSYGGEANAAPLYVIDDFISTEEEFNNLDIDEVEGISILKDGAAAIYGAYGAYGVILVKTKRGQAGKPKISYRSQMGYVDAVQHAKMLNGYDYGRIYNAARAAKTGKSEDIDTRLHYFQADELEAMRDLDYNLLEKYWSSSMSQRHSINLDGGTEAAQYFAGVSYITQDGNIGKLDYDRWNYRAGVNAKIGNYTKVNLVISGNSSKQDAHMSSSSGGSQEDYVYMLKNPTYVPDEINGYPVYHSGMENDPSFNNYYNYKSLLNSRNNTEKMSNSMTMQGVFQHDFGWWKPLQGLTLKLTYSRNVDNSKVNNIRMENVVYRVKNRGGSGNHLYVTDPSQVIGGIDAIRNDETLEGYQYTAYENLEKHTLNEGDKSYLSRSMARGDSYQLNFTLNYNRKFGDHSIGALFSIEKSESESEDETAKGTHPLSFTDGQSSSLADDSEKEVSWNRTEGGSLAYIYRFNYAYKDRYLFEFLMRQQASTKFSPDNYWGSFPGVSAGWVISEESWFDKEKMKLDFLKMRVSLAKMGHDNVLAWRWKQLYAYNEYGGAIFGTNPNVSTNRSFQLPEKSGTNPDLHWDTYYKYNIGIDAKALDNHLSFNWDAYYDMGRDMFAIPTTTSMPGTVGIYPAAENYGELDQWGTEIIVGWHQRVNRDLQFTVKLGTAYDDNKVLVTNWDSNPTFTSKVKDERSDRGLWGLSCMGMFRSYIEIEEYFEKYQITDYLGMTKSQVQPGMLIYEDIRGEKDADGNWTAPDGVIDTATDLVCISKRENNPYNCNFYFNVGWKGLTVYGTVQAEWGAYTLMPSSLRGESFDKMETVNISQLWRDMFVYDDAYDAQGKQIVWANRSGSMPNIRYSKVNSQASTFWRMSAAEVMLRNVTVAYTLPKKWVRHIGLSNVRLNMTCQNAFSFYNPIKDHVWDNFAGSYGSYPVVRTVNFGCNVTF